MSAEQYVISTVAGGVVAATPQLGTSASIAPISGLTVDNSGNVYFANRYTCIFKLDSKGALTRVVGTGRQGFSGDGGPAVNAQLSAANSPAFDALGNLYVIDATHIRRVSSTGVITTIAGTGSSTFSGDGGPAINAGVLPSALAVDKSGNIFIADGVGSRIRKIGTDGIIRTIAGTGTDGFTGDGGPALEAQLSYSAVPALAVDAAGNLYLAATANQSLSYKIRKIALDGSISSIAGNGTFGYGGDGGPAIAAQSTAIGALALDNAGSVYVGDGARIRQILPDGTIQTIAGVTRQGFLGDGGPATNAELQPVSGLAVAGDGTIFLSDGGNFRVRKISAGIIQTVAGNGYGSYSGDEGPATAAQLDQPVSTALDTAGNLYIADLGNFRVRKVSLDGVITTVAGDGTAGSAQDGQAAVKSHIGQPAAVAVDGNGNLYISDFLHNCIWKVTTDGTIHRFAGGSPGYSGDGGQALQARFQVPTGLAIDKAGNVYLVDPSNNCVRKINTNGIISTIAGTGTSGFSGDGGPAVKATLNGPAGIATDVAGNLYIADAGNRRIRKIDTGGIITTLAGTGTVSYVPTGSVAVNAGITKPQGIAVDEAGNLYFSQETLIYMLSPDGIIYVIAGDYSASYTGDGGPALNAGVFAYGVSVDVAGRVYSSDDLDSVRVLLPVIPLTSANSASNIAGAIAPGEIITLYGSGLGPDQLAKASPAADGSYPTQLANTIVTINGVAAPLLYAWSTQTAAIVPYATSGSAAIISVSYAGKPGGTISVNVADAAPALFTSDSSGKGQAAAINQDNTLNSAVSPAHTGDIVTLFATGEGQTSPAGQDGQPISTPYPQPMLAVTVKIGGQPAKVLYAGGAPGEVAGVMQLNVQIPSGVPAGNSVPIVVQVGSFSSPTGVTLAIQ